VRPRAQVTIESLVVYESDREIDCYQNQINDFDGLTFVQRSFKVMPSTSRLNISETVRVEALLQRTTNRKWPRGNQMVT